MRISLLAVVIVSILAGSGCARYEHEQGGTGVASDRTLGSGGTGDTPATGGTDLWSSTNEFRGGTFDDHNGRLGDSPH